MNYRQHPLFSLLREIKKNTVDFYRMQRYYGAPGKLLSVLAGLPLWRTRQHQPAQRPPASQSTAFAESRDPGDFYETDAGGSTVKRPAGNYPRISIITPVMNQAAALEACFASMLDQNYPNLEYIVIDCGSSDESIEVIKGHAHRITHWCSRPFSNNAQAINEGLKHATGNIFNWLFPEDRLEPKALFRCAKAFFESRDSAAWVGAIRRVRPDGSQVAVIHPNGLERDHLTANWNDGQFGQSSCFLATSKTREIGALAEDRAIGFALDLWVRLLAKWDFSVGKGVWSKTLVTGQPEKNPLTSQTNEWAKLKEKHGLPADKRVDRLQQGYRLPPHLEDRFDKLKHRHGRANNLDRQPTIAVIGYSLPRFDKASSEFRLNKIIQILLDSNCRVDYFYGVCARNDVKYKRSFKGNIRFIHQPYELGNYLPAITASNPDVIWISELWRITYIEFIVQLISEIKSKQPGFKLVVDTVDFHFKEFQRKYQQTGNLDDLDLANQYLGLEKQLYRMADVVTVVTQEEKNDILGHIAAIGRIEVIPNVHDLPSEYSPLAKRRNICFLGNFGTTHNADAVRYFLDHIFDYILKTNPSVEFHVLGYLSERHRKDFRHPNVRVVGGIKNLHKALGCYRLFVCPLTYGAGMKGKIGDAMIAGTPVVTTSLGAEGFPVKDGNELFIADCPEEFAEKSSQCLNDPITWHHFSLKSKLMIAENYSSWVVARQLGAILSP